MAWKEACYTHATHGAWGHSCAPGNLEQRVQYRGTCFTSNSAKLLAGRAAHLLSRAVPATLPSPAYLQHGLSKPHQRLARI